MTLDARCEEWLDRLVADAPPLEEAQKDIIAAAFAGSDGESIA